MKTKRHPLMYKGFIIKRCSNNKLSAYSYSDDMFLNPLYNNWQQLKSIIDAMEDTKIISCKSLYE